MSELILPSRCAFPGPIPNPASDDKSPYTTDDLELIKRSYIRAGGVGLTRTAQGLTLPTAPTLDVLSLPGLLVWFETSAADEDANPDGTLFTTTTQTTPAENNGDVVGRWVDQSGNDNHYSQSTADNKPTVQSVTNNSKSFLAVQTADGKFMSLSNRLTTVKQIYIVAKHATGSGDYQPILGDSQGYDFHGGQGTALYLGGLGTNVADGLGWINGTHHPEMCYTTMLKPSSWSIITNVTKNSATVATDRLTRDRDQSGRYWTGQYAAVILCSSVHGADTRNSVHEYLAEKYGITLA